MVQLKNQLPKTERLRGEASTTVLYEPLAQSVIPHGLTKPSRGFPGAGREKPCDYQTDITLQRERAGAVVPKKGA
jgi:hypothetical protein